MNKASTKQISKEYKKIPCHIKALAFQLYQQDKELHNLTPIQKDQLENLIETYQIKYKSFYNWSKAGGATNQWTKEKRSGRKAQEQNFEDELLEFIKKKKEVSLKDEGFLARYELDDEIEKKLQMGAYKGFKASSGWRNKFFKRHDIDANKIYSKEKRTKKEKAIAKKMLKNLIENSLPESSEEKLQKNEAENIKNQKEIEIVNKQPTEPQKQIDASLLLEKNFFNDYEQFQNYQESSELVNQSYQKQQMEEENSNIDNDQELFLIDTNNEDTEFYNLLDLKLMTVWKYPEIQEIQQDSLYQILPNFEYNQQNTTEDFFEDQSILYYH